jgi:hypothetical protein
MAEDRHHWLVVPKLLHNTMFCAEEHALIADTDTTGCDSI